MDTRGFARVGWIGGIRAFGIEAITHRSHITLIEVALSSFTLTLLYKTWLSLYFCFTIQLEVFSRGSDSCFCQGSRLLLVHRRKFGWSSTLFFQSVQLFIIVEAFSHCLTIIFNQFNESWYPVRPFIGWSVLNRPSFTLPENFCCRFSAL